MSFLLNSTNVDYLSNKEKEDFLLYDEDENDFDFQYIPANHLKNVVKNVRRHKIKMNEERMWTSFLQRQQLLDASDASLRRLHSESITDVKHSYKNLDDVDSELQRLKEDAIPEINKRTADRNDKCDNYLTVEAGKVLPETKETGTGSANILLMIPEEESTLRTCESVSKLNVNLMSERKKSASDHAITRRGHCLKLVRVMDDSEYNSTPEASPDRMNNKEDEFFLRSDPIVVSKILAMQTKVSAILDEISFKLDKIPVPDGEQDLSRRLRRVAEFSVRFSRNYLYDLGRQITTIQRHVRSLAPNARPRPTRRSISFHLHAIGQKMTTAHQILIQALHAYCKHIPSSVVRGHPGKLKEILQMVMELKDICIDINITNDHFGSGDADMHPTEKETHRKCSMILTKLQPKNFASDNDSQLMSQTTRSMITAAQMSAQSKRRIKQKELSNRFSMYSMEMHASKVQPRRRPNSNVHRDRRYVGTNYSTSLPRRYPLTLEEPNQRLITASNKSSKETIRNAQRMKHAQGTFSRNVQGVSKNHRNLPSQNGKIRLPPREDDIRTMMDVVPVDSDISSSIDATSMNKYFAASSLYGRPGSTKDPLRRHSTPPKRRITQNFQKMNERQLIDEQELTQKVITITEKHLSTLVPAIADLMSLVVTKHNDGEIGSVSSASIETLRVFVQKYQSQPRTIVKPSTPVCSKEIRSGMKNMQLICLPCDDTQSEKEDKLKNNDAVFKIDHEIPKPMLDILDKLSGNDACNAQRNDKRSEQINIPRALDVIITEYRHRYQNFTQESPMYMSNTNNKPWDVVAWIADKLVDELVVEISKELQMDNVIKRLFDLEFEDI